MKPRTIEFNARTQYGENFSTEHYQRMQHKHEKYRQLAIEHSDKAIKYKKKRAITGKKIFQKNGPNLKSRLLLQSKENL
jgi:hypothetical protein